MIVVINDISFLWGCTNRYIAKEKLILFCNLLREMKADKVSNVKIPLDLISSDSIHKGIEIAPGYTLIQIMNEIKCENYEMFNYLLYLLTQCGDDELGSDVFALGKYTSKHIAKYRDSFFVSLGSDEIFEDDSITGTLNGAKACTIKNLAKECHLKKYWQELGIREYELNSKHGGREYVRSGGHKVSEAPETDELGQYLVNHIIEVQGKLYAVDKQERIFEIKYTAGNSYHVYRANEISKDLEVKIRKMSNEKYHKI